jgi:hypothetical protein
MTVIRAEFGKKSHRAALGSGDTEAVIIDVREMARRRAREAWYRANSISNRLRAEIKSLPRHHQEALYETAVRIIDMLNDHWWMLNKVSTTRFNSNQESGTRFVRYLALQKQRTLMMRASDKNDAQARDLESICSRMRSIWLYAGSSMKVNHGVKDNEVGYLRMILDDMIMSCPSTWTQSEIE